MGFLEISFLIVTKALIRFAFCRLEQQGFYYWSNLGSSLRFFNIGEYFPIRRSGFRWINFFTKESNFCSSCVGCSFIPDLLVTHPGNFVSSTHSRLEKVIPVIHLFPYFICSLRVALTADFNHVKRYMFIADSLDTKLHSHCTSSSRTSGARREVCVEFLWIVKHPWNF